MEQFAFFLKLLTSFWDKIFIIPDKLVGLLSISDWIKDAIIDTIHMLPFLFLVFLIVELIEHKYADKIKKSHAITTCM